MIKHIVCWTLKAELPEPKEIVLKKICNMLKELSSKIEGIHSLETGINIDTSTEAYDVSLCMEFKSQEELKNYQQHPEHQKVIQYLRTVRDKRVVVDYEIK
jgi:hypothetical protein